MSYIRRVGSLFLTLLLISIFLGVFGKNVFFWCEDSVDIFGDITNLDYLFLGAKRGGVGVVISMHLRVFSQFNVQNGNIFCGVAKI